MTELGTALRELAGRAEAPHPADPEGLWRRGRARVRRNRIVGAAAATAVAVVTLVATSSVPEPHKAMPAGPVHAPAIPKNIYQPNRFLARISDTGAPGQLALIARGAHGWFGISATTGRYTALDLPGLATDAPVALSPDGSRIAYGVTGSTRKRDFGPADGLNEGGPLPRHPMVGVAVYDLRTGSIVKQVRETDFGFSIFGESPISWLGEGRVAYGYYEATGSNTGKAGGAYTWNIDQRAAHRLTDSGLEDAQYVPTTDPSTFVRISESDVVETDDQGTPTGARIRIKGWNGGGPSSISLSQKYVVLTGPYRPNNQQRVAGAKRPTDASSSIELTPMGDLVAPHLMGWLSPTSVLVTARMGVREGGSLGLPGAGYGDETAHLYAVDLQAQKIRELGYVDHSIDGSIQVARDLLDKSMVPGQKPPPLLAVFRIDLIVAAGVLAALGCWFLVRRRRRG